jgi:tight adherence protein C
MIGSIACSLAVFFAFQVLASGRREPKPLALARISAMTSGEIRRHEVDVLPAWRRWLLPPLRLLGTRLKLRPERIDRMFLIQAGLDPAEWQGPELRALRFTSAAVGALIAVLLSLLDAQAFLLLPLAAWVGYLFPVRYLKRRRRLRQEQVQRELPDFVGLLRTFMSAGLPLERSLHLVAAHAAGLPRLSEELKLALAGYGLGESIEEALEEMARRCGVDEMGLLAAALAQGKRLGSGLEQTLRDQELLVRWNQRNRATAEASRIGTRLLLVMAAIYLPEFVILIMIPLFWGIFRRAFG